MMKPSWRPCSASCETCPAPLRKGCKGSRVLEIIVVDGADDQKCREVCDQYDARWVPGEPCRGRQLLAGAALARGDALWFLHADARLPPDPILAMERALEQNAVGGYFRFRFDAPRAWPALLLEPAIALRCRAGVPYGDQGLFMTRRAYVEAGGHSPWPLFEEVALVRGLRRLGRFCLYTNRSLSILAAGTVMAGGGRTWVNRNLALAFARGVKPTDWQTAIAPRRQLNQSGGKHA